MQSMILENIPNSRVFQTSTTRKERAYEKLLPTWQQPYHFYSHEEFEKKIANNEFFEYELIEKGKGIFDYYGTRKADIQAAIDDNEYLYVAVLEPHGAEKIHNAFKGVYVVFIAPPSLEVLRARALTRKTEGVNDIDARLERAETIEIKYKDDFNGLVINANRDSAFNELQKQIKIYYGKVDENYDRKN